MRIVMTHKSLIKFLSFCLVFLCIGCSDVTTTTFNRPDVESFVVSNNNEEFLVILAYGGSSSNSISYPIIKNENNHVRVQFTNKRVKGSKHESLYTSYRSFSGADRQVSTVIQLSNKVEKVSYYYDEDWVLVWERK